MKSLLVAFSLVGVSALAQVPPPMPPAEQPGVQNEGDEYNPYPGDSNAEQQPGDGQYVDQYQQDQYQQQADQAPPTPPPAEDAQPVEMTTVASVQAFEPALAPYGDWVNTNGVRGFRPAPALVGNDFTPYASHGRWVSTEAGWSFSTSLPFGWATYHYGRWWFDPMYGWIWIPDTTWGPAWVDWRYGGGYTGWAPLPPVIFASYYRPRWFFVNSPYFCSHNLYQYRLPSHRHAEYLAYAQPVPYRSWRGRTWSSGPSYHEVARVSAVPPVRTSMTTFGVPSSSHGSAFVHGGNAAPPPAHVNGGGSYGYVAPVPTRSQMPLTNGFVSPGSRENRGQPQGGVIAPAGSHGRMEPSQPYAPPSYRSAPPPAPVQHFAPPAQHFSPPPPPAQHFSPPAPRMSSPAPSHSFSGGGFSHGGGGGRHR
jgi:hypothetical protein